MKSAIQKSIFHKSTIPGSRIFIARELCENHFDPAWHAHPEYQLFLVLEGTGTRFIGNTIKHFEKGDLTFLGPNVPHLWRNEDFYFDNHTEKCCRGVVIYFHNNSIGSLIDKEEMQPLKNLFIKVHQGMEIEGNCARIISDLMLEIIDLRGTESFIQFIRILDLLSKCKEYKLLHNDLYFSELKETETDRINIVFNFAVKNFKNKIKLEEVAELLNMTPTSFSRYFIKKTNKTFTNFLTELRINNACKMLSSQENKNIAHICYESGFNTLSNFNKQFKEFMKMTPYEYKSQFFA